MIVETTPSMIAKHIVLCPYDRNGKSNAPALKADAKTHAW
jgi:hypothetical protein